MQPAVEAVKQWVYKPVLLNGQPVGVMTTVREFQGRTIDSSRTA
jgi:hypothetical protein